MINLLAIKTDELNNLAPTTSQNLNRIPNLPETFPLFGKWLSLGMITSIEQLDFNKKYSYADYLTWQLGEYVELLKGKIFRMSPAPSMRHQEIGGRLFAYLFPYFVAHECKIFHAPFDVRLLPNESHQQTYTVVQPDICVVCDGSKLDERGCIGAPDLVVEILSPSTSQKDLGEKFNLYEEAGVKEYWIVDPLHQFLDQYALSDGKYMFQGKYLAHQTIHSTVFPEAQLDLEKVFQE